jgi:hypothetical protein
MLVAGILFGILTSAVAFVTQVGMAIALLMIVGAVGGMLVVPLNALLQDRGNALLSAGRSIAVQGASENAGVLACLAVYAALAATDVPLVVLMAGLGAGVVAAMSALLLRQRARDQVPA